jgi:chemotaxis-related protein WspD
MPNPINTERTLNDCWNKIGVEGDRSCPELVAVIHCRNCPVYSSGGRSLLEREAPEGYLAEWTNVLAQNPFESSQSQSSTENVHLDRTISVMIFRLGGEWLALPVRLFQEITQPCIIHSLPHRSNELFLGLVNIRGEILICISLSNLLDLEKITSSLDRPNSVISKRMVVVANEEERWVFSVDEVCGVYRFPQEELQSAPVVVAKATEAYTKGVINWQEKKVNYLNYDALFHTLNNRVQ